LALADVNGDGALDLFVGGSSVAGRFPEAAASFIARNEGNRFVPGQRFERLGLVRGAVFSDLDGDGDPDLVLACQWGPLRVLRNEGGTFTEATEAFGLSAYHGLWNSVATADLDNDGRPDLIAGNWGLNSKWQASAEHPLRLYYGDFDGDGILEMIEARWEESLRQDAPLRGLRYVATALPWVAERIGTFAKYGTASVREVYGERLATARVIEATTLSSTVFLNRGGKFEAHSLPPEAQWSPVFGVAVADLDGDGNDDVFLAQNFFGTHFEMTRADAGCGLWLRGDGKGGLTPMAGRETGVSVHGEARGAAVADYDGDGRPDLVVTQNGAETKLFRNRRATPGVTIVMNGPVANAACVGGSVQWLGKDRVGPMREIQAGSGYWSQNSRSVVLGRAAGMDRLSWRAPSGIRHTNVIPAQARRIILDATTGQGSVE
jgi:enediyne biosynthesis protein E4